MSGGEVVNGLRGWGLRRKLRRKSRRGLRGLWCRRRVGRWGTLTGGMGLCRGGWRRLERGRWRRERSRRRERNDSLGLLCRMSKT